MRGHIKEIMLNTRWFFGRRTRQASPSVPGSNQKQNGTNNFLTVFYFCLQPVTPKKQKLQKMPIAEKPPKCNFCSLCHTIQRTRQSPSTLSKVCYRSESINPKKPTRNLKTAYER
jgi:hypothetical protein